MNVMFSGANFFDQVSEYLHANFAWELATHTSDILERSIDQKCRNHKNLWTDWSAVTCMGMAGERKEAKTIGIIGLVVIGQCRLLPKHIIRILEESRAVLLEKVLELTKEDNFPISFLSWLTEHVDGIWKHDPEFVTF